MGLGRLLDAKSAIEGVRGERQYGLIHVESAPLRLICVHILEVGGESMGMLSYWNIHRTEHGTFSTSRDSLNNARQQHIYKGRRR